MTSPELLRAAKDGSGEAIEQIITENNGLIWSIARRYFGRGVDSEDLYQLGCVGFIKALKGFDESYGTQFSTYAVPKIAGEIRRFIRDDGLIKVSRSIKEKAFSISNTRQRLVHELQREPVLSELSAACGIPAEEIAEVDLALTPAESFQKDNDGLSLEGLLGIDGMEEELVERISLREAINSLPEREKSVLLLRYYKNLTQEKTAVVLGVSQVQVSRIERKALEMMRKKLQAD